MNENIKLKGHISIQVHDAEGRLKQAGEIDNVVVTVGKNYLASWLAAASQAGMFMQYVALGTGTTSANSADTTLQTEIGTRVAGAITSSTNVWQNVASFGPGVATGAITEAGLFTASSAGTMFAHQVFGAYNKTASDTLTLTWQVTFS